MYFVLILRYKRCSSIQLGDRTVKGMGMSMFILDSVLKVFIIAHKFMVSWVMIIVSAVSMCDCN